ncbi:uncharacterized protein LOC129220392 [Uloborus diversus]|uniref:uncharacterized protein LOC129220392 n=1 Tax=Uloborus diversus TaxID=327109 RepID=UPI00240A2073|nr:uncharacterized protein LOC129220392 [Uloborus diversus]
MGIAVSCGGGRLRFHGKKKEQWSRIDPVVLNRSEASEILNRECQKPGTYLLYEDVEKEKICLAFKTTQGEVVHYSIVRLNDLFYFNDFPFPYLESIVLYYKKYKFKDTRLTHQAVLSPQVRTRRSKRIAGYLRLDAVKDSERDSHA